MKQVKLITLLFFLAFIVMLTGCNKDDIPGNEITYAPWFPGSENSLGMTTVIVGAEGGENMLMTNINGTVPFEAMFSNVIVSGNNPRFVEIAYDDESACTPYDESNIHADHSSFDWCNPLRRKLFVHKWLGVWQKSYELHLFVQPNTSTQERIIYVKPNNFPIVYGFLTVVQKGAADGNN